MKLSVSYKGEDLAPEWQQIVWAEVYAPNVPDSENEFMDEKTVREMAYQFMRSRKTNMVDLMHNNRLVEGCAIVESFIAREDDTVFIPGSWVVALHIPDPDLWQDILDNKYNGFSLEALAYQTEVTVDLEFNPEVRGTTTNDEDHEHSFVVYFDEEGNFLGGKTDVILGHSHEIKRGTVTELANGHRHKFHYIENYGVIHERDEDSNEDSDKAD